MSSLKEIEAAIGALSPADRVKLVQDLPSLIPECEGDLAWQRILHDPTPSPALSRIGDELDAEFERNPDAFPKISEADFRRNA